jgi:DNA-binding transcriptional MerR regulator
MTTQEVSEQTGIAPSTVRKYAEILKIAYQGEGYQKKYNWKNEDIDRLKKIYKGRTGRPPKKAKTV